jgi:cyclic lactone autoinducer peptide
MTKGILACLARAGSAAALRTAKASAPAACMWFIYQPKTPRNLAERVINALKK